MSKKRVIGRKWLPINFPISMTWLFYITADLYLWPGWAKGVGWTIIVILWVTVVSVMWDEVQLEPDLKEKK